MKIIEAGQLECLNYSPSSEPKDGVILVGTPDEVRDIVSMLGIYREFDTDKLFMES